MKKISLEHLLQIAIKYRTGKITKGEIGLLNRLLGISIPKTDIKDEVRYCLTKKIKAELSGELGDLVSSFFPDFDHESSLDTTTTETLEGIVLTELTELENAGVLCAEYVNIVNILEARYDQGGELEPSAYAKVMYGILNSLIARNMSYMLYNTSLTVEDILSYKVS